MARCVDIMTERLVAVVTTAGTRAVAQGHANGAGPAAAASGAHHIADASREDTPGAQHAYRRTYIASGSGHMT